MIGIIYTSGENERKRRKPQREVPSDIEREIDRETEGESGDGCTTLFGWEHYAVFQVLGVMYATRRPFHRRVNENQDRS